MIAELLCRLLYRNKSPCLLVNGKYIQTRHVSITSQREVEGCNLHAHIRNIQRSDITRSRSGAMPSNMGALFLFIPFRTSSISDGIIGSSSIGMYSEFWMWYSCDASFSEFKSRLKCLEKSKMEGLRQVRVWLIEFTFPIDCFPESFCIIRLQYIEPTSFKYLMPLIGRVSFD